MDHAALNWPGPHDGDFDHQVVEATGAQPGQHAHLRAGFDLKNAHGVGGADHLVGVGVFGRNVLQAKALRAVERAVAAQGDEVECAADGTEHAECQHIDLEQAEGIEVVLVPLDDAAFGHGRVFDRHQPRE